MEQMTKAKADWLQSQQQTVKFQQQTDEKRAYYDGIMERLLELSMGDSSKKTKES